MNTDAVILDKAISNVEMLLNQLDPEVEKAEQLLESEYLDDDLREQLLALVEFSMSLDNIRDILNVLKYEASSEEIRYFFKSLIQEDKEVAVQLFGKDLVDEMIDAYFVG